ncbi:MAG: polymer-forming cytoskeletal protein [Bacteroidales bacterium]|jgi:cytoskeletal protein CcmA (bactofilin family)|nr:polymer-forming cytoskeletal protein [Bacteroidales bacterium]
MAKTMEPVNINEVSRISAGTVFKGEITSPNDIRIDGTFEGKVYSKGRVVVGDKAVVKGDIICQNVDFWGKMTGNFYVKDTLSLKSGCIVDGDLHVKRLQVELDAKFNGNCKMISESEFDKIASEITGIRPAPQAPAAAAHAN